MSAVKEKVRCSQPLCGKEGEADALRKNEERSGKRSRPS